MARVPEEELTRLKRDVKLEDLAGGLGVELKKHGKDLVGLCCFHEERTPSLVITPSKNIFHCFGCGAKGSVVDWVMRAQGVSFRHAVELLRAGDPLLKAPAQPVRTSTTTKLPPLFDGSESDEELLEKVVAHYHETLKHDAGAREYLEKRRLLDEPTIEHFRLGFADRSLGYRLPQKNRKAGEELRSRLTQLGVLRESGHEHFRGCVVVPVRDEEGRLVQLYGRRIAPGRPGSAAHLYLPRPLCGVFNADGLKIESKVILCESIFDALTYYSIGAHNVTTSFGTNGVTDELISALVRSDMKRLVIAFDRDEAGDQAAARLLVDKRLTNILAYRALFPSGMDVNEYAVQAKSLRDSLARSISAADHLGTIGHGACLRRQPEPGKKPAQATSTSENTKTDDEEKPAPLAAKEPEPSPAPTREEPQQLKEASSVVEPAAGDEPSCEVDGDEVRFAFGARRWRVRGLLKNLAPEVLKVNVLVGGESAFHVDTFDLYAHKARTVFVRSAAEEICADAGELKRELGRVLLKLEDLQARMLKDELSPKEKVPEMSDEERKEALAFLRREDLLDQVLRDFDAVGVVGEETNKLTGYLAAISRKLKKPLAVMVQSSSAAGKSSLMEAVLSFVPDEEKVAYSAMTGQSLFYMEDGDLRHKVLAIAEEEGAERASYALKVLQSEGRLRIASTGKDPQTGRHVTSEYEVQGPVAIFSTTTSIDVDEELLNRCLVLTVDESREQTRAIHRLQRERRTLEGLKQKAERDAILARHNNAQRLIRPLAVSNAYGTKLTFVDDKTRTRRDQEKYLTLIDTIALLHQHQRQVKTLKTSAGDVEYIEVQLSDIEKANELAHQVLGRSLDELPPQTRRLLENIEDYVDTRCKSEGAKRSEVLFTRRQLREASGFGNTQLKVHMQRLEELEYVLARRGGPGQLSQYELLYDGQGKDGGLFMMGLVDVKQLAHEYDENRSALGGGRSAPGRAQVGGVSGRGRGAHIAEKLKQNEALSPKRPPSSSRSTAPRPRERSFVAVAAGANGALPASEAH